MKVRVSPAANPVATTFAVRVQYTALTKSDNGDKVMSVTKYVQMMAARRQ